MPAEAKSLRDELVLVLAPTGRDARLGCNTLSERYEVRDFLTDTGNAVRQRDQFLAMLGHELRNPLGAISNALTVIDAACPPNNELESEQRAIIRRQGDHLARLVDDLLDVSRITSG